MTARDLCDDKNHVINYTFYGDGNFTRDGSNEAFFMCREGSHLNLKWKRRKRFIIITQ